MTQSARHDGPAELVSELGFVRRVRRAIHRHPELAHDERRTASYVERVLLRMGLSPFRPAPTSVAVVIGPAGAPPAIGFRADMDAIPVLETTGADYASRNRGVMHACGHDAHTAALLTLARRLTIEPCPVAVLLIFQQAEETYPSGAPLVIKGLPSHLMPREIFAFHVWPELPEGVVGSRGGTMMASVAGLTFDVHGREGRASGTAVDSGGIDAVSAAVELYGRLAPDTGRQLHDAPTALSIGVISGGDGPNRVATRCRLEGTLRALSWAEQDAALAAIEAVARAVEQETGSKINIAVTSGIRPPVRNSAASVARLAAVCRRLEIPCLTYPERPTGVSEDFGWYLDKAEGALFLLGCAKSDAHPDLHTPNFDLDEVVVLTAIDIFQALAATGS
jgi:amidohydrolase